MKGLERRVRGVRYEKKKDITIFFGVHFFDCITINAYTMKINLEIIGAGGLSTN